MTTSALSLCLAIVALWSDVPLDRACSAAEAIVSVATPEYPAELLAAIAVRESSFDHTVVNRKSMACGAMQVIPYPRRRSTCDAIRASHLASYTAGVERLRAWESNCRRRGRRGLRCVLAGYGGRSSVAGVLYRMRAIRQAAGHAPGRRAGS